MLLSVAVFLALFTSSFAINFDFERIQLTEAETVDYPDIRFADQGAVPYEECKYLPEDDDWPQDEDWARFNETLGGALLKPLPLATPCYAGPLYNANICALLRMQWAFNTPLHASDPTSITSQWSSGYSCVPTSNPNSTCTQGGWPLYVVNATTARHVQLAVNFARNRNIRLAIKNSGHDFNGKTLGGGALSVWVHNLKGLTYYPNYTSPEYTGRAVAYAGGTSTAEASTLMLKNNFTMHVAGGSTVGIAGGWLQAGGHSSYTSQHGLAADNALQLEVVTADGRLVTASAKENPDLFWALRGGGGGNYGIITSVIMKAWERTTTVSGSIMFSTIPTRGTNQAALSSDTFWAGVREYFSYCIPIVDAGGLGYNFIRHTASGNVTGLSFQTSISLPNKSMAQYRAFVRPLLQRLNDIGIAVPIPAAKRHINPPMHSSLSPQPHHLDKRVVGELIPSAWIASRFFLRSSHSTPSGLDSMTNAIRSLIEEGGLTFHGINHAPTRNASGNADNAVLPAWRDAVLHAQGFAGDRHWDGTTIQRSFSDEKKEHDHLQKYMQKWRDVTPGSGSYQNEGDAQDPSWKEAFYGANYARLEGMKKTYDPWGVFWVIGGVTSDEWEVRGSSGGAGSAAGGIVTQDGRLCRVDFDGKRSI
ncbi:hypothetical protein BDV96DRAFT_594175 [Lophiotrema nucula]|uniref:FAD-binding PCMH-type domain-containing protein n=1 Tax=Lophiotrema nucula TaxID=690887 RepID=A0A6A5ZVI7_9PLEO|nr:hypothetical protein BDV96DRAFT_594175 [Lophiotrema nucula]